jgi:hypothetical protein
VPVNVNPVLNSNFSVWQRGTTFTGTAPYYNADRWQGARAGAAAGATWSRQNVSDSTNLPNIQYCLRISRDNGNASTALLQTTQSFESVNSIPLAGKTVVISFYARKGATYSGGNLNLAVATGTGTDQGYLVMGYTGSATPVTGAASLTTTWQRFTYTGTLASTTTEIAVDFQWTPTGTAGATDYVEITGIQLEAGSVATPYKPNAATFQGELAACQRYYWRVNANQAYSPYGAGSAQATTTHHSIIYFPTIMRTKPSSIDFSTLNVLNVGVAGYAVTALTQSEGNIKASFVTATVASGLTAGSFYALSADATSNGYLGFSAEL